MRYVVKPRALFVADEIEGVWFGQERIDVIEPEVASAQHTGLLNADGQQLYCCRERIKFGFQGKGK